MTPLCDLENGMEGVRHEVPGCRASPHADAPGGSARAAGARGVVGCVLPTCAHWGKGKINGPLLGNWSSFC